ncbi:MAG: OadG family protein [Candidatus Kuenenia sp.]|nr:OadG family protein [Candidatus Kuenenia hertensis]
MEHWSFWKTLSFQITGLSFVIASLSGIALLLYILGYCIRKAENRKSPTGTETIFEEMLQGKPEVSPQEMGQNTLLAVITTAVDEVIKEPHRIVSIRQVDQGQVSGELYLQAWSAEGRRQHFASHKVR